MVKTGALRNLYPSSTPEPMSAHLWASEPMVRYLPPSSLNRLITVGQGIVLPIACLKPDVFNSNALFCSIKAFKISSMRSHKLHS